MLNVRLAIAAMLMCSPAARAGSPLNELRELAAAQLKTTRLDTNERRTLEDIQSLAGKLDDRLHRSGGDAPENANLPDDYSRSLTADLETLLSLPEVTSARAQALEQVRDDLRLKWKFAEGALGFAGGFPAVVKVTVETVRDGKKVDGLYVRGNPRRWGQTANPTIVFNSASSPTTANVPPGLFVLWVESPDKKVLALQPIEVGGTGSDSETIRLALP